MGPVTRHYRARALAPVGLLTFDRGLRRKECECNRRFGYALMKRFLLEVTDRSDMVCMQLAESRRGEVRGWAAEVTLH
jgi:hypothetical protein